MRGTLLRSYAPIILQMKRITVMSAGRVRSPSGPSELLALSLRPRCETARLGDATQLARSTERQPRIGHTVGPSSAEPPPKDPKTRLAGGSPCRPRPRVCHTVGPSSAEPPSKDPKTRLAGGSPSTDRGPWGCHTVEAAARPKTAGSQTEILR